MKYDQIEEFSDEQFRRLLENIWRFAFLLIGVHCESN